MDVALVRLPPLCRLLRPLGGTAGRTLNTGTFVDTNKSKERKESDTSLAYVSHLVVMRFSKLYILRSLTKMQNKVLHSLHS